MHGASFVHGVIAEGQLVQRVPPNAFSIL
jgi:hypothetical protein